jgi:predicted transposase/invertase (TIGR01784 family)
MKIQIDPKVDYAFKHVFGREESKPALVSLLNAVLQPAEGKSIASLELLNPFNEKTSESGKLSIVDIKARDQSGRQFLIEMQMLAGDVFRQRALYYWATLYQEQLHQGEDWPVLRPTIAICFVDTPLFAEIDDYHLTFELRERRRQTLFTDQLALHILELPKFHKKLDELTTPLDQWLYLLRHGEELDAQAVPVTLDVAEVRWALGDLFMISRTDPDRELYEARLQERRDKAAERQALEAALAGQQTAREKGRAEGRAERWCDDIQYLQDALGHRVTSTEELQALSLPELERLAARLRAELKARLANGS